VPNCPRCQSRSTQPVHMALATGTRRRSTVGFSRSLWVSRSTYRSDFVSSLPSYPSNFAAYFFIIVGGLAAYIGLRAWNDSGGSVLVALGTLAVVLGFIIRKTPDAIAAARETWQRTWVCKRCGNQWTV
jgi:hypothetical protein